MQINELKPKHYNKQKKRVGRGGRKGTYSGRGMKGQKQRAGRKMVPLIRELIKRYPKLRGYKSFRFEDGPITVNLGTLEGKFNDGDIINPENLIKSHIISKIKGKIPKVKILGTGKFTKKLIIKNCGASKSAKEAIEKAGGSIK
jgi:large subunit ribosomal protein L15